MSKTIKIINNELVEIASYRNPEVVFHNSNNPRHVEPEYDNFESYCDYKEVINPFELYEENQQLKKQKADVVELIKRQLLSNTNITKYTDEMCLRYLLRMLGEIE